MNPIQTLIQELEEEKANLQELIDEAVQQGEYLVAHFHSEAMGYVNKKLQTLRNLDDKDFDAKRLAKSSIRHSQKELGKDHTHTPEYKEYLKRNLENEQEKLNQLNRQEKVNAESKILVGHLKALIAGEIKGIRIILKKSSNFKLDLSADRSGITIEIANLKNLRKNRTINEDGLQHFLGLGFTLDEHETKLTLQQKKQGRQKTLLAIQTIISKIVFDIYYFKEFRDQTFIEILE